MSSAANTNQIGRGPFAVLSRAKYIAYATERGRDRLLRDAERLENWAAGLVLGAIVLEAVVWISPLSPLLFKLGNFAADAAVAVGIYGEMRFGHIVSDILKFRLAAANARAADAQEQLRRFRTPRHQTIDPDGGMTGGHMARITENLRRFGPIQFDTGLAAGSGEPMHFLWRLEKVLRDAGWIHLDWMGVGPSLTATQGSPLDRFWVNGIVWADDVEIHVGPLDETLRAAAEALAMALNEIGIAAAMPGFGTHSANVNTIHVLVGLKQ